MSDDFQQSRWFVKIDARIEPDGVRIRERSLLRSYETKIPFHQIPDDVVRISHSPRLLLVGTAFLGMVFAYRVYQLVTGSGGITTETVVWSGVFFVLVGLSLWAQSGRFVGYLCGTGNLYFFEKKGGQDPSRFLARIHEAKLAYFRHYREAVIHAESAALAEAESGAEARSVPSPPRRLN